MLMTDRSDRGSPKPRGAERLQRDDLIWEANRGVNQGQQPCCAARTGRTHGCIRPVLIAIESLLHRRGRPHWLYGHIITQLRRCRGRPLHHVIPDVDAAFAVAGNVRKESYAVARP